MQRAPTNPEARLPWPAGVRGDDARGLRQSHPRLLTGAVSAWATFSQRPRAIAGRSCPRSTKATLRLAGLPRPTGKRRGRRLRLWRCARGGSAGALRNHHVGVPSASHTDMLVPFNAGRAAGRLRAKARAASSPLAAPPPLRPTARMSFAEGDASHGRAQPRRPLSGTDSSHFACHSWPAAAFSTCQRQRAMGSRSAERRRSAAPSLVRRSTISSPPGRSGAARQLLWAESMR